VSASTSASYSSFAFDNDSDRGASVASSASASPHAVAHSARVQEMMSKLNLAAHMLQHDDDDDGSGNMSPLATGRCRAESIASVLGGSFDEDHCA
jgi:hypothetical protein